jgi:hypothetical protein
VYSGSKQNTGRFQKGEHMGENHPRYKGGCVLKSGYKQIFHNGKRFLEHRFIMEQYIKRKLKRNEVIHHINHIKTDNRIDNLKLMSNSEHTKAHPEVSFKKGHPPYFHISQKL